LIKKTPIKWILRFSDRARKNLKGIDKPISKLIIDFLYENLETEENPRRLGKPLTGNLKNFWRYRVGDYRIICEIKDREFKVIAVKVAHRREIYKNVHFLRPSS